jgi:cobalt-zinc-cadmium efflux system outer membrane protein
MYRVIAALLAVLSCAPIAQAQAPAADTAGPVFTLDSALSLSGTMAPSIDAASAGVRAAEAGRAIAGLRPNPTIGVETENVVGSGQYQGLRSAETTAGVSLPIELGGKRSARVAVASSVQDRASIAAAIATADLRLGVTQAYVEAVSAERRLVAAREQADIASEALRAAHVRVQAGRASPIEQQRADVLRINADAAVERAERQARVTRSNLERRIGRSVAGVLDLAWFERVDGHGQGSTVDSAATLELAAALADVRTATAQVRLARSQRVPDLTVSASARRLEASNDVAAVFGVSIPFPLFNRGAAALAQASAQRDQAEALRRMTEQDVAQAIASADAEVANAATAARTASGPALAAASEAARIARIGYREGKFGQLDLLDAERTLSETRMAAIDAHATYRDAQARRERLATPAPEFSRN